MGTPFQEANVGWQYPMPSYICFYGEYNNFVIDKIRKYGII